MAYDTPTREQLAQDYAKALAIINRLRAERDELLHALKGVSLGIVGDFCFCRVSLRDPLYVRHTEACVAARAAIAKAEGR
jgi:hypothetical protein